jgi:UDP-N-acetylglucosamine 2-epimerase
VKTLNVVGARPNFMKISPLIVEIIQGVKFVDGIKEIAA